MGIWGIIFLSKWLSINSLKIWRNLSMHPQMQVEDLSSKKKAMWEHEKLSSSLGQSSFQMSWEKVEKPCGQTNWNLKFFQKIMNVFDLWTKEERNYLHVISAQFKSLHLRWYWGVPCLKNWWLAHLERHDQF